MEPLHTSGFVVLRGAVAVSDELVAKVRHQSRHAGAIFNYTGAGANDDDGRRRQQRLMTRQLGPWTREVEAAVAPYLGPSRVVREYVAIISQHGCQQQALHWDYDPDACRAACTDDTIPLAVIVTLMPDTCLVVSPGAIRGRRDLPITEITTQPGDIVVFRGDLIHAGAAYPDRSNVRVHAYVDVRGFVRQSNATYPVPQ